MRKFLTIAACALLSFSALATDVVYEPEALAAMNRLNLGRRVGAAVGAAMLSNLLSRNLRAHGLRVSSMPSVKVVGVTPAVHGAIAVDLVLPFPADTDPCEARLRVIGYRDGAHSVRPTDIYRGAMGTGPAIGVISCED